MIDPTFDIDYEMSISSEVKSAALFSESSISSSWGLEFNIAETWSKEETVFFSIPVMSGKTYYTVSCPKMQLLLAYTRTLLEYIRVLSSVNQHNYN